MFDISDITLIAISSAIVIGSSAVILLVNYRRLPCCRPEAAPVAPQEWVRQPTAIIQSNGSKL